MNSTPAYSTTGNSCDVKFLSPKQSDSSGDFTVTIECVTLPSSPGMVGNLQNYL